MTIAAEGSGVARFRREAEVAARLNHPGITTVFDIDEHHDGNERWLFLVMELMVGRDLRHLLAVHPQGLPIERATELAVQITDALAAAHRQGVVHRDIKLANLFLLEEGRVKICDFGIARLADATKITTTGSSAGTPVYMAPEQIQGGDVDRRTDLYAFGCVLYELLTGTPWVDTDAGLGAILFQHLNQPSAPPRSVRAEIPEHLDALVLDLLAKQPDDRPQDAASVADRLRPDEPRRARPTVEVIGPPDTPTADAAPDVTRPARTAVAPTMTSPPALGGMRRRTVLLGGLGAAALIGVPAALLLRDDGDPEIRPYLTLTGHAHDVNTVAFSRDGKTLATGSDDDTARLWDVATGRAKVAFSGHNYPVYSVTFSPDGTTLAAGGDGVRLWNMADESNTATTLTNDTGGVYSVAFSPEGKTFASCGDQGVQLWDVASGRSRATLTSGGSRFDDVTFSPDGKTLATGSGDNTVRLWDAATGRNTATFTGHTGFDFTGQTHAIYSVAFSPDGKTLAIGGTDHTVRLWDVAIRRTTAALTGHTSWVDAVAFSPDGTFLATGSKDRTARLWKIK